MRIAIVTDSTAYIPQEVADQKDIYVLPLSVIFGQEVFSETTLSPEQFFKKIETEGVLPTSSQPSPGIVHDLFERLAADYDAIISIHLSSKISGTYQTAVSIAEELQHRIPIYVIDSGISCAVQARPVFLAAELAKHGFTPEEIVERCYQLLENSDAYFIVDDLSHLQRGGRLSAGAAMLGSLLKIKPVLKFENKEIVVAEKIRTQAKAQKFVENLATQAISNDGSGYDIAIIHADCEEKGLEWVQTTKALFPKATVHLEYFGPVVATHLGKGALGMTWAKVDETC